MSNGHMVAEIRSALSDGTRMPPEIRDRLILAAIAEIMEKQDQIIEREKRNEQRIENLEKKSIVIFAERHPKMAALIMVITIIVVNAWTISGFRKPLLGWLLGVPEDLIP